MQITIRKGPDDQTERVVNNDESKQWNKVGDKKYLNLKCPHCDSVCVTFTVSKKEDIRTWYMVG